MRWLGAAGLALVAAVATAGYVRASRRFAAEFAEVDRHAPLSGPAARVEESDLGALPAPVAAYLRAVGVVGRPRVQDYRLQFIGRIRSGPDTPWMPFEASQRSVVGGPIRLFLMHARMRGLPVQAFHRYEGGRATIGCGWAV